ncbi:MAG: hypothetical protein JW958_01440 [Candidatus Eisenbacteria bacterium]|nr:hypothetical protein [Candidatus Eisenbacteria bacterium]
MVTAAAAGAILWAAAHIACRALRLRAPAPRLTSRLRLPLAALFAAGWIANWVYLIARSR